MNVFSIRRLSGCAVVSEGLDDELGGTTYQNIVHFHNHSQGHAAHGMIVGLQRHS
jgi:hypothetical protein